MLSVAFFYYYAECHYAECHHAECRYADCHYAECHYAECRGAYKTNLFFENQKVPNCFLSVIKTVQ